MEFPFIVLNNLEFLECRKLFFFLFKTLILPPWVAAPLASPPYTPVTISDVQMFQTKKIFYAWVCPAYAQMQNPKI